MSILWSTEKRKLAELKNWEKNPRTITEEDFNKLKERIEKRGFHDVLKITPDNTVLSGNQRLRALKELGIDEVDVKVPDRELTQEEMEQVALESNVSDGAWDYDKMANEFDQTMLDELGVDIGELDVDVDAEEDEVPEPPKEPKAKLGEIYQLGEHRLMCGDSTKTEDVEKLMDGQKADMVFTDPPYGIEIVDDDGMIGKEKMAKAGVYSKVIGDDTTDTARSAYNVFVDMGIDNMIIWGGNYFVDFLPFSSSWIIWDKRGDMASNNFADGEMAWTNIKTRVRIYKQVWAGMIKEGESDKRVHPTQKPIKLLADIVNDFSDDGDRIIDTFGGSGSTLIACEQLDRKCYMMELDPQYIDVIIERWENLTGKEAKKL